MTRHLVVISLTILSVLPSPAPADPPPAKKLIEFGWDEPDTEFLRRHIAAMERTPFDGCVFHAAARTAGGKVENFSWLAWGARRFTDEDLRAARDDLKATERRRFTQNFLRLNTTPADLDWFDDHAAIVANARLAASLARDGGGRGVLLDVEQYGRPLFSYRKQRDAARKPWDAYAAQARRRGREVMAAFQDEFPGLTVLLTFGHSLPWSQTDRGRSPLADAEYGLLAPFLDGMIAAAEGRSRVVDGYELSYGFRDPARFAEARRVMTEGVLPIVADPARQARFAAPGFGLWLDYDWRRRGWDASDPSKNYFTPASFEAAVRAALASADEFVWIYTETPRWWGPDGRPSKLPPAYADALRRARRGGAGD